MLSQVRGIADPWEAAELVSIISYSSSTIALTLAALPAFIRPCNNK